MKAMISQPMRGRKPIEIEEERQTVTDHLHKLGYEVVSTYFPNIENKPPLFYLAKALEKMSECDLVFFCPGWEQARGCKIEHLAAEEYGLQVVDVIEE